jgi:hypothetical protein
MDRNAFELQPAGSFSVPQKSGSILMTYTSADREFVLPDFLQPFGLHV